MKGTHISLFAGVGMTDIAVEAAGFKTVATAEIEPWCRALLRERFPVAHHYGDVRDVRGQDADFLGVRRPLLISGGFPCQDISALTRDAEGLSGARSGLWGEFDRIIGEFSPEYVLIENTALLRSRGLGRVLYDLADQGYYARWDCIPAAAVGAPHLRDRIFVLAARTTAIAPDTALGKTVGSAQFGGVQERHPAMSPAKLPRAGFMVGRIVFQSAPLAPVKDARNACLARASRRALPELLPTPRRASNEWRTTRNAPSHGAGHGKTLAGEINDRERAEGRTPAPSSESSGNVSPGYVEWVMGLPLGWTDPSKPNSALLPFEGWGIEHLPRTEANAPHRRARLRALGNGLVPQAAAVALGWLP